MDYHKLSKEELIIELESKNRFLEHFEDEKEQELDLTFAWTGNLGHWYWDVKENIVKFNKKKATALGYSEDEIPDNVGFQWFTDKLHPDDYEPVMQNMRNHLYNKSEAYEVEYRIKAKNGSWKWYYDRGTVTQRNDKGEPLFLAGIVFDITDKKEVELKQTALIDMLSQQLKIQENIYSVIFHDLANPLNSVIGFSRILQELMKKHDYPVDTVRYINMLSQASNNAVNITKTLVNWTKAKKQTGSDTESIMLLHLLKEIFQEFIQEVSEKNINPIIAIGEYDKLIANKSILKIAIRNFISNAIKYSNPQSDLTIEFKDSTLIIEDNGIGMSEETLRKLFQSSITPMKGTAKEKGNGIGLMLVKELLDQAGIKVDIQSKLGEGTKVSLIF